MTEGVSGWRALGFSSYQDYLQSDFWLNKREWILQVLGNRCARCVSTENLNVHHLNYWNAGNEGLDDVIILCKECHKKEHGKDNS